MKGSSVASHGPFGQSIREMIALVCCRGFAKLRHDEFGASLTPSSERQ
jgi:hypothetical protein